MGITEHGLAFGNTLGLLLWIEGQAVEGMARYPVVYTICTERSMQLPTSEPLSSIGS